MEQIESLYENINKKESQEYFKEVLISYQNGSYRSAIVMLYSVVISDILYKLKDMVSIFNDEKAKKILDEIQEMQSRNPNSPEWEKVLIEKVKEKTKLIDVLLHQNISHLKILRNLSAHPVIDRNDLLISPSREDVIAQIRNMLEQLFVKPSIFTKDVEDQFFEDLDEKKDYLIDDSQLEKYIQKNYLQYFNDYIVKNVFRGLWKFTFELDNRKCKLNRDINYRTLQILFKQKNNLLSGELKEDYCKEHISFDHNYKFNLLVKFIAKNNIFENFDDFTKEMLKNNIKNDENLTFIAYFLNDNVFKHLKVIEKELESNCDYEEVKMEYATILYNICKYEGALNEFLDLSINIFRNSHSFDIANNKFDVFIEPYLSDFNKEQVKQILSSFDQNGQISGRRRANGDLKIIFNEIERKEFEINTDEYVNIKEILDSFKKENE